MTSRGEDRVGAAISREASTLLRRSEESASRGETTEFGRAGLNERIETFMRKLNSPQAEGWERIEKEWSHLRGQAEILERRADLLSPSAQRQFEAAIMWSAERGGKDELDLLRQVKQKPPFKTKKIMELIDIAEEWITSRLTSADNENVNRPLSNGAQCWVARLRAVVDGTDPRSGGSFASAEGREIVGHLVDEPRRLRVEVVRALLKQGDDDALAILRTVAVDCPDPDPNVRWIVADGLSGVPQGEANSLLERLARADPDETVRTCAIGSLRRRLFVAYRAKVGPEKADLNEALRIVSEEAAAFWADEESKMVEAVEANLDAQKALEELEESGIPLRQLIHDRHVRLQLSLRQDVPPERILCGFNAIVDVVYELSPTEVDALVEWVTHDEGIRRGASGLSVAQVCAEAHQIGPVKPPLKTPLEVLATLMQALAAPNKEWKPVMAPALWEKVRAYVDGRKQAGRVKVRMGGASGNMAHALSSLGLDITAHWLYHPSDLASDSPLGLKRLTLEDEARTIPASEDGYYSTGKGKPGPDPVRRSFAFDFSPSVTFCEQTAGTTGRVIFLVPRHVPDASTTEVVRPWQRVLLRTTTPSGRVQVCELENKTVEQLGEGWPFFPVFCSKHVDGNAGTLVIEIASDSAMESVAEQFDYFMLSGIQALDYPPHDAGTTVKAPDSDATAGLSGSQGARAPAAAQESSKATEPIVRTIIKHALMRQLDIMARNGVVIHWEIGGVSSPKLLDDLAEIARGRVKTAALNHSELFLLTGGMEHQEGRKAKGDSSRYRQTRYYCGSPEGWTSSIVERLDRAMHLARQLALDELYVHGNDVDLIVRRRTTRTALRQKVAITLFAKGAVLLALLSRSGQAWRDYVQQEGIPPVFTPEGFATCLTLAHELAMRRFKRGAIERPLVGRTLVNIVRSGYYYEQDPNEYSVIVVPVMWPKLNIHFATAGAGDITSSVVAVYSGE